MNNDKCDVIVRFCVSYYGHGDLEGMNQLIHLSYTCCSLNFKCRTVSSHHSSCIRLLNFKIKIILFSTAFVLISKQI